MAQRNFVTFEWPSDDTDERELDGEIVPAGCTVIQAIHKIVCAAGYELGTVEQHDSYGWGFEFKIGRDTAWVMLQLSDTWLIVVDLYRPLLRRLFGNAQEDTLGIICKALHKALLDSPHASNIQWFTRDEFQVQKGLDGAPSP